MFKFLVILFAVNFLLFLVYLFVEKMLKRNGYAEACEFFEAVNGASLIFSFTLAILFLC